VTVGAFPAGALDFPKRAKSAKTREGYEVIEETVMAGRAAETWMWSEACEMLARAERLHQQFFQLASPRRVPVWEPPVDMLETRAEILIFVALPGVDIKDVEVAVEDGALMISGQRTIPPELRDALIHRLELPQGRFERRLPLPPGRYDRVTRAAMNGCLVLRISKAN
jgi:HSP20 family protein